MKVVLIKAVFWLVLAMTAGWWLFRPMEEQISARITPNDPACADPAFPHGVTLTNTSLFRTVTEVRYEVSTKRAGYSSTLDQEEHHTDKIIGPLEEFGWCVPTPDSSSLRLLTALGYTPDVRNKIPDDEVEYSVEVNYAGYD
jgi:hypothetical protein